MEQIFIDMIGYVFGSLLHNWLPLSLAILTAAIVIVHVDPEKLKHTLLRKPKITVWTSVAFGAFTPLCACGTMAVILGLLTTALPWGPIMAFLTSSPLMSPDSFILVAGIIDFKFAVALTAASIIIGVGSGYATHLIETKTTLLKDQVRFVKQNKIKQDESHTCGCSSPAFTPINIQTCNCSPVNSEQTVYTGQLCCAIPNTGNYNYSSYTFNTIEMKVIDLITTKTLEFVESAKLSEIRKAVINIGIKQILFYYSIFAAVGFLINSFIPASIIAQLFSAKNIFAVPLAAVIGLPIYINGESMIPLIQSLMAGGASGGSMLAFLITGPGTSAGVIAGISTIMGKRAIILYVFFLLVGGIILGYLYDFLLLIFFNL